MTNNGRRSSEIDLINNINYNLQQMFGFLFSKKKVDAEKVQAFKDALEAINIFILISEWEKAKDSILEIEHKERI